MSMNGIQQQTHLPFAFTFSTLGGCCSCNCNSAGCGGGGVGLSDQSHTPTARSKDLLDLHSDFFFSSF